ncbi:MAG: PAS domain S-box protein [Nitrospiraceae bacterium]|nr:MAG: PAS domain S-box protein [Nitrospiraceae bacterium]
MSTMPDKDFPIVAIGASAGGLNSIQCFLNVLPKDLGFAIVFLQHLSHKHGNLLPGLLRSGRPSIDIKEITDGMEVLPGRLYLCPPGVELRIEKGVLHTAPLSGGHFHLPIDEFFISLAEDAGERAIAVIFSGAGTDGARGIHEIKNAGGTVFVQAPATAEFPGMPLAAIDTGKADGVLSPEEIAAEILKLHGAASISTEGVITGEDFETFYRLIIEKTGYRFNYYKQNVINRRIRRRMYLRGVLSVKDYMEMVAENDAEAGALAADFMIGVTSFFRDRLAWKALNLGVIRKLAAEENDFPVRVWTPACATGEEAYSIAMMLHNEFELAGRKREIQVFATDVNDRALDKAREGKYPGSIAADVPPDFMKRYFTCSEDGLSVIIGKEIRERVVVAKQDLLTDPPFSRLDLIICRNLLIYLEPLAQEKCITLFHYALKEGGYLFLGNAESVGRSSSLFRSLAHKKCRVYQKIEATTSARLPLPVPFASERAVPLPTRASITEQQSVTGAIQESLLEEYAPAAVAINQYYDIIYHNGPTNRYLRQPRGAPTQNLLELLSENLRSRVRGAIYRTTREAKPVSIRASIPGDDEKKIQVTLRISRLKGDLSLIVFHEKGGISEQEAAAMEAADVDVNAIRQLESELSATRTDLQSHIEQLKSLNEELQSSNEELQAANEELETSREELQSLNEELITVNSQLQGKIEEQDETNNDLNNFLASTNIPTVFLDHRLRVKRFTPAMSRLLKLIPSDVGRPIADMSQEAVGPDLIADAQTVLDNLVPVKNEILLKDVWYVRTALPYRTSDNRIEGVIITYSDVTEIKLAEERTRHLAEASRKLAAVLRDSNDAIMVHDFEGNITVWNHGAERLFGWTETEALKMKIRDTIPAEKLSEALAYLETLYLGEPVSPFETKRLTKDGRVLDIWQTATVLADDTGKPVAIATTERDITERKRAAEEISRAREEWERTFANVPDMIAILDNNHTIMRVNESMARRLGRKPEECVGMKCYEAVHGTTAPPDFCPHSRTIKDGREHVQEIHEEHLGMDLLVTTTPMFDEQGKLIASVHVAHDITERKKAEEELRARYEELTRFNNAAVGRELRMIELKKEINELCARAGLPLRYALDFEDEQ